MRNKMVMAIVALVVIVGAVGAYFYSTKAPVSGPGTVAPQDEKLEDIVFGFNSALTVNSTASYSLAMKMGFEIAIDEINAAGGILGRKVRAVVLDDQGDKDLSRKNAEQLILQEKAALIIGPSNSGNALNWIDLAQDNEVITVTTVATVTEITTRYAQRPRNYIFRVNSLDADQMRVLIAWALKKTNNGKIAIVHDTTAYGMQGEKTVGEALSRWGKSPVLVKPIGPKATPAEAAAVLKEVKASGADAVMFFSLVDLSSTLLKEAEKLGDDFPLILGTAANAIQLWDVAGPVATNLYLSAVILDEKLPEAIAMEAKVVAKYGQVSPALTTTSQTYDVLRMIKVAYEKAGTTDRAAVRDAFEAGGIDDAIVADLSKPFSKDDHEGVAVSDFVIAHWVEGKRTLLPEEVVGLDIR